MSNTLTTDPGAYCFFDTETKALPHLDPKDPDASVKTAGVYRYARNARPIVCSYAIGDDPVTVVAVERFDGRGLTWDMMPVDFRRHWQKAREGRAYMVAWNAAFDREICNTAWQHTIGVEGALDAMFQAVASQLPADLESASRTITGRGKEARGKELISLFCGPAGPQPADVPEHWDAFLDYADRDIDAMRDVWRATRPLSLEEWRDYWTSERINVRGAAIDVDFVRRAAALADADRARVNQQIAALTGGVVDRVTQVARLATWAFGATVEPIVRERLTDNWEVEDGEDEEANYDDEKQRGSAKLSLARRRVEAILAFFKNRRDNGITLTAADNAIEAALTLRLYGGSTTPQKFSKILRAETGGRLRGQYVANGAPATGRFSSRGVQVHNLTRSTVGKLVDEAEVIEIINSVTFDS